LSQEVLIILGDSHYSDRNVKQECKQHERVLVTPQPGAYPHKDKGVEWRRDFHKQRSQSIEPFNGLYKRVYDWGSRMPMKGMKRSKLFALGAVFLYQLVLLYQHKQNLKVGVGIKPLLRAA
jgi:hypothetical protein